MGHRADATEVDGADRTADVEATDRQTAPVLIFQPPVGGTDVQRAVTSRRAIYGVLADLAGAGSTRPLGHELETGLEIRTDTGRARKDEARGLVVVVQTGIDA